MNRTDEHQHASSFGPPSELVEIQAFINGASALTNTRVDHESDSDTDMDGNHAPPQPTSLLSNKSLVHGWSTWTALLEERRAAVEDECSVADLLDLTDGPSGALSNVRTAAHLLRHHRATLEIIHTSATGRRRPIRKRGADIADPEHEHPDVTFLQDKLDKAQQQLATARLDATAALLMRTPTNSDYNALAKVKKTTPGQSIPTTPHGQARICLITYSVHVRHNRSRNYFTRTSQHAVLSFQTIGDMFEAIPCVAHEIPTPIVQDNEDHHGDDEEHGEAGSHEGGQLIGYKPIDPANPTFPGAVVCIEGLAYGDGQDEEDYSNKLLNRLVSRKNQEKGNQSSRPELRKGPCMHDVLLSTLSLQLHQPYWVLHAGMCEHWIVVDEIRMLHPADPATGYPLTTYLQPTMLPMCRACTRVPATVSVRGDVRLGESPCLLCAVCWRRMGTPGRSRGRGDAASGVEGSSRKGKEKEKRKRVDDDEEEVEGDNDEDEDEQGGEDGDNVHHGGAEGSTAGRRIVVTPLPKYDIGW